MTHRWCVEDVPVSCVSVVSGTTVDRVLDVLGAQSVLPSSRLHDRDSRPQAVDGVWMHEVRPQRW